MVIVSPFTPVNGKKLKYGFFFRPNPSENTILSEENSL